MSAMRYDAGKIGRAKLAADGSLHCEARISRCGVFPYRDSKGGTRREYRPPSEVFHPDSIESFREVVLCDGHPSEPIDATNATRFAKGNLVGTPRRDGRFLVADIVVRDQGLINKILGKHGKPKREISCGYECDSVLAPGVSPEGERYDLVQRGILGNHIALAECGRAGPDVRILLDRLDAADAVQEDEQDQVEQFNQDSDQFQSAVQQRTELMLCATRAGLRLDDLAALPDVEIQRQVCARVSPEIRLDGKSDPFVSGCFKVARELLETQARTKPMGYRTDSRRDSDEPSYRSEFELQARVAHIDDPHERADALERERRLAAPRPSVARSYPRRTVARRSDENEMTYRQQFEERSRAAGRS